MKQLILSLLMMFMLPLEYAAAGQMIRVGSGEARYLGFIKVYDAELYADSQEDRADILSPEISKCLKLTYDVSLKSKDFVKGASMVLERQMPAEQLEMIKAQVDMLHSSYVAVEPEDYYQLCYNAETAMTSLSLNKRELVAIKSKEFSKAYFGIWLSDNQPLSNALQKDLVGADSP